MVRLFGCRALLHEVLVGGFKRGYLNIRLSPNEHGLRFVPRQVARGCLASKVRGTRTTLRSTREAGEKTPNFPVVEARHIQTLTECSKRLQQP